MDPACMSPLPFIHGKEVFHKRSIASYQFNNHPSVLFTNYQKAWQELLIHKQKGYALTVTQTNQEYWIRVDVRNRVRHVNHHYLSEIDGHQRKYFLHVETPEYLARIYALPGDDTSTLPPLPAYYHPNHNKYSAVYLLREEDHSMIPYEHVYGATLIFALRLHLHIQQRNLLYSKFLKLPLYEDMASWNILITGSELSYIDYDTQTETFDADIVKVYRILEVLTNYKRTISDFEKCRERADNPVYNFNVISDCVKSLFTGPCKDTKNPIPCGDGTCKSDYISCLRDENSKEMQGQVLNKYLRDKFSVCYNWR